MDEVTDELTRFFEGIWKDTNGFVYLPIEHEGSWTKFTFQWPRQKAAVVRHTLKWSAMVANVFYSPALFKAANPEKGNVLGSWVLWVDFDGNAPTDWDSVGAEVSVPKPSFIIQSSIPGHEHTYWQLNEFLDDVTKLEELNRSLAYVLHADTSGWDADQILRPPFTTNHKRGMPVVIKANS